MVQSLGHCIEVPALVFLVLSDWAAATMICLLGHCREVNRNQLMLEYDRGGVPHSGYGDQIPGMKPHPGFQMCIAARYRDYKWMGFQPDKVYE